ncbi:MAG: MFS transporter, partial [Sphingobacteriales bacterium]
GMRALFTLFLLKALLFDKDFTSEIYGSYTGLVYLTPLIGGYVADKYWGNRRSIVFGGILMAVGQFLMFMSGSLFSSDLGLAKIMMFAGLGFLIFGNGFFKPNISTMVGQLYPANDSRVDGAFTIFYMGINLGAFLAPLVCGFFGDTGHPEDFKWGFLIACIGMILSVIFFLLTKDKFIVTPEGKAVGSKPEKVIVDASQPITPKTSTKTTIIWVVIWLALLGVFYFALLDKDLIGAFIFSLTIAAPGYIISDPSLTKIEKQRIWVIFIVAFFVIFFWSAFEQAGASLTYFAEEQTNRNVGGKTIPASAFQSVNAIAIVVFAPIFAWIWSRLSKKSMEPASPYKQAIGLFLLALGYLVIAFGVKGLAPGVKVSMMWLISLYTIHTFGELCLSPIGLSMVNKLAPVKFASLLMGVWFLSTAAANKFAGTLSSYYPEPVVKMSLINTTATDNNVSLLPKDLDSKKLKEINGEQVLPLANIQLNNVKDETLKETIKSKMETNQIVPEKSFMGFKIATLYDFFMLFVVMAGVSSVILFFVSKRLVVMMNGVK